MRRILIPAAVLFCILALACPTSATMVGDESLACPICGAVNSYQAVVSYGSYVYDRPSKFQYVFFPMTDDCAFYNCGKCRLSCYGRDARDFPKAKVADVKRVLKAVDYDPEKADDIGQRLRIAEKVYSVLKKVTDDEFWAEFYRVMGYHLGEAERTTEAGDARAKALKITQRMIKRKENAGVKKELLLISGAMRHYLKDDKGAVKDFEAALALDYRNRKLSKSQNQNVDKYLTDLLKEYLRKIGDESSPPNRLRELGYCLLGLIALGLFAQVFRALLLKRGQ